MNNASFSDRPIPRPLHGADAARGFTLAELLVAIAVFTTVAVIATGALLQFVAANQKAQQLHAGVSNLSFALDLMTRNVRTGLQYYCAAGSPPSSVFGNTTTRDCAASGTSLVYTDGETSQRVGYRYRPDLGRIERREGAGDWIPVTSSNVMITDMQFVVEGTTVADTQQPVVGVTLEGYVVDDRDTETDFRLQTHITQRAFDI